MFCYSVHCSHSDAATATAWLTWLADEHLQDVIQAGAQCAEVFEVVAGCQFEIRYQFASEEAFEVYQRDHAPALRAEGLKKFPLELRLEYSRSTSRRVLHRPS